MNCGWVVKRGVLVLVLAGLAAGCGGGGKKPAPAELPQGPHPVVILAIDGLGAERLGAFGSGEAKTPHLDALVAASAAFDWAFAQAPAAAPSLASLLTGVYPATHGVKNAGSALPDEALTLPEIFSRSGYETAAFVNASQVTADLGFAQGFTTFDERGGAAMSEVGARAAAWMKQRAGKNFFLLIAVSDLARSGGTLAATDSFVGDFWKAFSDLGLDGKATLAVFGACGPGDGSSLRPSAVRVPLLLRFPGGARAHRVADYAEIVDLGPTLMAAGGIEPPANLHGKSLLPLVRGEGKPPYVAFGESGAAQFVALGGYQLIHHAENGRNEVFHLAADPSGNTDIAGGEAKRIEVLSGHLDAVAKLASITSLDPEKQAAPLDDASMQKLKSLGYVQ